jgi:hypothetical protein
MTNDPNMTRAFAIAHLTAAMLDPVPAQREHAFRRFEKTLEDLRTATHETRAQIVGDVLSAVLEELPS